MRYAILLVLVGLLIGGAARAQQAADEPETRLFFDDFNYDATDSAEFTDNGWIVRTEAGWPGVPGAVWSSESVSIIDDPDQPGNRLVEMTASSDSTTVQQAQFCQARKFFEGTYAARVRFSDSPASGPDGDQIVQTFYQISPLAFDLDPDYSELDFEYLPNGGWGSSGHVLYVTSWETFRPEPNWLAQNISASLELSFAGWHTLVMQVGGGKIRYFVDGKLIDTHDGDVYPEVPMSLNFNLWFINGGQLDSDAPRQYVEQVDWAFHITDRLYSPEDVDGAIAGLRTAGIDHVDTVAAGDPALESPCNF